MSGEAGQSGEGEVEGTGCQKKWMSNLPLVALGYPQREVKSIAGMIEIHIPAWRAFFSNADEALATVIIKSFTDAASVKHLKGFAVL